MLNKLKCFEFLKAMLNPGMRCNWERWILAPIFAMYGYMKSLLNGLDFKCTVWLNSQKLKQKDLVCLLLLTVRTATAKVLEYKNKCLSHNKSSLRNGLWG